MRKKILILLLGVVIVFGVVYHYQGLGFALAILCLIVLFGGNLWQSYHYSQKMPKKKYHGYVPRESEDVFYDSRLKTLRRSVVNKELDELEYKRQRDKLVHDYNEGKVKDKNER